jgi:hypothetical protein
LDFGDIELHIFQFCRELVSITPIPHNFRERTGRVVASLRKLGSEHEVTIRILEQSVRFADKRNTVAHYPMQYLVFEHRGSSEVRFDQAIKSEVTGDNVDDVELTELRAEAESFASRLYMALGLRELRARTH